MEILPTVFLFSFSFFPLGFRFAPILGRFSNKHNEMEERKRECIMKSIQNASTTKSKCSLRTACEKAGIHFHIFYGFAFVSPCSLCVAIILLLSSTHLVFVISFAHVHYRMLKLQCFVTAREPNGMKWFICFIARQTIRCRKDLDMATETCTSASQCFYTLYFFRFGLPLCSDAIYLNEQKKLNRTTQKRSQIKTWQRRRMFLLKKI